MASMYSTNTQAPRTSACRNGSIIPTTPADILLSDNGGPAGSRARFFSVVYNHYMTDAIYFLMPPRPIPSVPFVTSLATLLYPVLLLLLVPEKRPTLAAGLHSLRCLQKLRKPLRLAFRLAAGLIPIMVLQTSTAAEQRQRQSQWKPMRSEWDRTTRNDGKWPPVAARN